MHELPPLSHPSHNASFDEGGSRRFAPHHRRDHSGTSTTSSLSVGGFSLSSHEGPRGKFMGLARLFSLCSRHSISLSHS